ncbi:hypothetical protein GL218_01345 [Daldinia childiae]|uniref:uncharacterized protein n=1 Tax=Daldinia childiae TaxID=326645 RepID=UPI0014452D9F|nr:uncharacterized protein GL218_01345 [Daldinia childiae]KAF3064604.1 hypothetical protein GL218_01345 [Daldinia childiae]
MGWASWLFVMEASQYLLRSPTFQRGVRRIHKTVEDYKHGRDPSEPLREGEATRQPTNPRLSGFMSHFTDELRNQVRGTTIRRPKK